MVATLSPDGLKTFFSVHVNSRLGLQNLSSLTNTTAAWTLFRNSWQFIILLSLCKLAYQALLSCAKLKRVLARM